MTQYKFTVGSSPQSVVGNLTWNANSTLRQLGITDPFYAANTQNCAYQYDDIIRLISANCGSAAAQTFSYNGDGSGAFGNVTKSGSPYSFTPAYSSVTNRMTNITIDSVNLTYDALGRMVEQNRSGTYSEIMYAPTGEKIEIMNGQSYTKAFVALPGGAVAVYGGPVNLFRHADHLGSSRFVSTGNRTMYYDGAYAPFGEPYSQSGTTDLSFTGMNQDTVAGLYDFPAREYSIQGRWTSPDPAGLAAVNPTNPQSWNRYAYVQNSPLNLIDPLGLYLVCVHGEIYWRVDYSVMNEYQGSDFTYIGYPCSANGPGLAKRPYLGDIPYRGGIVDGDPDNVLTPPTAPPFTPPLDVNSLQTAADQNILKTCKSEAEAAAGAEASPMPNANSVLTGVLAGMFNMFVRGVPGGGAGKGFLVGFFARPAASLMLRSQAFNNTYSACMAQNGVLLPPTF
jgi:RHS repeat-associated protein